jgi:hypothetical protein
VRYSRGLLPACVAADAVDGLGAGVAEIGRYLVRLVRCRLCATPAPVSRLVPLLSGTGKSPIVKVDSRREGVPFSNASSCRFFARVFSRGRGWGFGVCNAVRGRARCDLGEVTIVILRGDVEVARPGRCGHRGVSGTSLGVLTATMSLARHSTACAAIWRSQQFAGPRGLKRCEPAPCRRLRPFAAAVFGSRRVDRRVQARRVARKSAYELAPLAGCRRGGRRDAQRPQERCCPRARSTCRRRFVGRLHRDRRRARVQTRVKGSSLSSSG